MSVFGFKSNKCKKEVYAKEDFAVVTAKVTPSNEVTDEYYIGSTSVPFPSGFNKDNCCVVSVMYKNGISFMNYVHGYAIETGGAIKSIVVSLGKATGEDNNNIYVQVDGDWASTQEHTVKILLMKI